MDSNSAGSLSKADRTKSSRYLTHPNFKTVKARGTKAKKEQVYAKQMLLARFRMIQQYLEQKTSGVLSHSSVDPDADSDVSNSKLGFTPKAIVHAIVSPRPQLHYDEAAFIRGRAHAQKPADSALVAGVKSLVRKLVSFINDDSDNQDL